MTTPNWSSAQTNTTANANQINQFLGTHQTYFSYDGSLVGGASIGQPINGTIGYSLTNPATTAQASFAQGFNLLTGSTIDRIAIPVFASIGRGQDVTVSIQTDNAGAPSGVLAGTAGSVSQVVVPHEFLQLGLIGDTFEDYNYPAFGSFSSGTNVNLPAPANQNTFYGSCADTQGNIAIVGGYLSGGGTSTNTQTTFSSQAIAGGFAPWMPGPTFPTPTGGAVGTGLSSHTMVALNGYCVTVGGQNSTGAPVSDVYVASLGQGGIGSWTKQTSYATNICGAALAAVTPATTGIANTNYTIIAVGGQTTSGGALTDGVYTTTMSSSGSTGSWTQLNSLPYNTTFANAAVVNNWLVVAGGGTSSNLSITSIQCWGSKILVDVNGNVTLGGWVQFPSLGSSTSLAAAGVVVINDAVVLLQGINNGAAGFTSPQSLRVSTIGPASAWINHSETPDFVANYAFTAVVVPPTTGGSFDLNSITTTINCTGANGLTGSILLTQMVSYVSVPLHVTGLVPSTGFYHIVIAPSAPFDAMNVTGVTVTASTSSGMSTPGQYQVAGGAWQTLPQPSPGTNVTIQCAIFQNNNNGGIVYTSTGAGARQLHALEDGGARWTWQIYQSFTSQMLAIGEYAGNARRISITNNAASAGNITNTTLSAASYGTALWGPNDVANAVNATLPPGLEWGT